jgi:hypothetical protein
VLIAKEMMVTGLMLAVMCRLDVLGHAPGRNA